MNNFSRPTLSWPSELEQIVASPRSTRGLHLNTERSRICWAMLISGFLLIQGEKNKSVPAEKGVEVKPDIDFLLISMPES